MRRAFYKILVKSVCVSPGNEVYEPSDDSLILAHHVDYLVKEIGGEVLDVGTGSGIQAIIAAKYADRVVGVDINERALEVAAENAELNGVADRCEFRKGDLFSPIRKNERFDLIIFNPPYLPTSEEVTTGILDAAWNGGEDGRKVIEPFIQQFGKFLKNDGTLLLLHCHLADTERTIAELRKKGFGVKVLEEVEVFPERLSVLYARRVRRNG